MTVTLTNTVLTKLVKYNLGGFEHPYKWKFTWLITYCSTRFDVGRPYAYEEVWWLQIRKLVKRLRDFKGGGAVFIKVFTNWRALKNQVVVHISLNNTLHGPSHFIFNSDSYTNEPTGQLNIIRIIFEIASNSRNIQFENYIFRRQRRAVSFAVDMINIYVYIWAIYFQAASIHRYYLHAVYRLISSFKKREFFWPRDVEKDSAL